MTQPTTHRMVGSALRLTQPTPLRRPWPDRVELVGDLAAAGRELVVGLQAEEEALRQAEVAGETQVRIGGDGALAEHDLVDAAWGHMKRVGERGVRQAHGLQELLPEDLARVEV